MIYLYMFWMQSSIFEWIELDLVIGIFSLEFFEKLWQTKYRLDRIFFSGFYQ